MSIYARWGLSPCLNDYDFKRSIASRQILSLRIVPELRSFHLLRYSATTFKDLPERALALFCEDNYCTPYNFLLPKETFRAGYLNKV